MFGSFNAQDTASALGAFNKTQVFYVYRGGERFQSCAPGGSCNIRQVVDCIPMQWKNPAGMTLFTHVMVPCPECAYPGLSPKLADGGWGSAALVVGDDRPANWDGDGRLTVKAILRCPAHWQGVNKSGQATGGTVRCGWAGVIRNGRAHNEKCPHSNFNNSASDSDWSSCKCGAVISDQEKSMEKQRMLRR